MAITLPNLGLSVWNAPTDPYNSAQLAQNWQRVDEHDHSPGKGRLLATNSLADFSVTNAKVADDTLTSEKFAETLRAQLGVSQSGTVSRGITSISATETRTNTAYGLMPTPDRVSGLVLPTDGLIAVAYQAMWQESVQGAARAAIFIGANQMKVQAYPGAGGFARAASAATGGGTAAIDVPLFSTVAGLASVNESATSSADVTTGQAIGYVGGGTTQQIWIDVGDAGGPSEITYSGGGIGGGVCYIFAATGTYDVSVQFKAATGSVTAKNRKLWVWTIGF